MIVLLLMYRKTPWNNHASVITIILIYLRWQTEWFYSGSIDTHVDSSTKENVSNPSISKRHSCIEKPWNWKSLRTNLGSYAEGALQNRHSACLSRCIKFYGKIIYLAITSQTPSLKRSLDSWKSVTCCRKYRFKSKSHRAIILATVWLKHVSLHFC